MRLPQVGHRAAPAINLNLRPIRFRGRSQAIEAAKNVVMMDVALLNAEIKRHVQEAPRNPRKRNPLRAACTRRPRRYSPKLAQLRIAAGRPHRGDGA
jgi:hypothetical protein